MTHPLEDENARLRSILGHARQCVVREYPAHPEKGTKRALLDKIDAALAAEPASGEANPKATGVPWVDGWLPAIETMFTRAPTPPPTQGEEERARGIIAQMDRSTLYYVEVLAAALRQRADDATEVAALACEQLNADKVASGVYEHGYWDACNECAAAIRARLSAIAPPT